MNISTLTFLLILGFIFIALGGEWFFAGFLCFAALALLFISGFFQATVKTTKKAGKTLSQGIGMDLEKAQGQFPGEKVFAEIFTGLGHKAGEFASTDKENRRTGNFSTNRYRYTNPKPVESVFNSAKNMANLFKKLFD